VGKYTLEDLRARALKMADVPAASSWAGDIDDDINDGLAELHDEIITLWQDCVTVPVSLPVLAGASQLALPADFYSLREIFIVDGTTRAGMNPWEYLDRDETDTGDTSDRPLYRVAGQTIYLMPKASKALSLEVWYVQAFKRLEDDHDELPAIIQDGWAIYPVAYAAAAVLAREESDPSYPMTKMEQVKQRIKRAAATRKGRPRAVQDITGRFSDYRSRMIAGLPRRS
jgi:hypothetical protein